VQRLFKTEQKSVLDLMGEFIPHLIEQQHPIKAYVSDAFWYDLGSLERYERFENEGLSKRMRFLKS
jgi:mannose-1-phosphate guanylyltransferase